MTSEFGAIIFIQLISIGLAVGVVILLAFVYDKGLRSMSWYSSPWLIFGIYFCPFFFFLGIAPSLYVMFRKTVRGHPINRRIHRTISVYISQDIIRQSYFVQMFQHAQCFWLVLLTLALTALGVRSTFVFVMTLIFYSLTTFINCFSRLQLRGMQLTGHLIISFIQ